jgi:hypothetical protein
VTFAWQLIVSVGAGAGIGFIVYKIMRLLEPTPRERTREDRLAPFVLPGYDQIEDGPTVLLHPEDALPPDLRAPIVAHPDRHVVQFQFSDFVILHHPPFEPDGGCTVLASLEAMRLDNGQMQVQGTYVSTADGRAFERWNA